jgi:RNA polymerase sigma-70 factor (ECF subfamily)
MDASPFRTPDPDLIQRARHGDNKSIGLLFEPYQQGIFRYLYYQVGERHTAEDLTMEVYLSMVRSLPGFQPDKALFQDWLFQIARKLAADHSRLSGRSEPLAEDFWNSDLLSEDGLDRILTHEELLLALVRVDDEQREVIILRLILQMPIEEVALLIGRNTDAVKDMQCRGLQALRNVLSENGWWQNVVLEKRKQ